MNLLRKQTGDDQSMLIDGVDQDSEKQQDVTIISPQQSLDSESIEEKDQIVMADNCWFSDMVSLYVRSTNEAFGPQMRQ